MRVSDRSQWLVAIGAGVAAMLLVVAAAAFFAARDDDDSKGAAIETPRAATPKSALALGDGVPEGTVIGLIVSNAGPGRDLIDLAAGAYVATFRLNGAEAGSARVRLAVRDDGGDAAGATKAVDELVADGVAGIVYGSAGDQFAAAAQAAERHGVALLAPYAGDSSAVSASSTTFLTGPSESQAGARIARYAADQKWARVAALVQTGSHGDRGAAALTAAGLSPAITVRFDAATVTLAGALAEAIRAGADAVVVWSDVEGAAKAVAAADAANLAVPMVLGPRVGVPAFGRTQAGQLAAPARDGLLSVGLWAGPSTPTRAVDDLFDAKAEAVGSGAVSADVTNASLAAHDAVLAVADAARQARSRQAAAVLTALRKLVTTSGPLASAGVPLDFTRAVAVSDSAVAMLTYSTLDDGSGRFADAATGGGHWMAVEGTFDYPESLAGLAIGGRQ